ncbi:glycoside hydrolase family 18 protein [Yersinia bercovieri]|uniref:glycoside hydrolase family 18 protein n=1 Tax=Yersinia bercovieri TaxID=634 RepID=UPI0011AB7C6F|nr:glycosyl hydrolase family 18 protein [Yersinia bercovieri]
MTNITKPDQATDHSYVIDGFIPTTETQKLSYTSARVVNPLYNHYATQGKPKVFGYYTDWSQYDGRLEDINCPPASRGRGVDLALLDPMAFDKIIIGFVGILGDQGDKSREISAAAPQFARSKLGEVTFLDPWGDCQSARNNGFDGWVDIQLPRDFYQDKVRGVLGGLRDKQAAAQRAGHNLILSFSIGGWTMSDGFYHTARDPLKRANFCASVVDLLHRFDMFSELDLDWEYPGAPGNGNSYGPDDWQYYKLLVQDLKAALTNSGLGQVKISIATSADPMVMALAHIPELISAGVEGINLMTYDFFGTPWAAKLNHHSNLYSTTETAFSVDAAVNYLLDLGVNSANINIGYAGYTRNGHNATIESESPLSGHYIPQPEVGTTTGSFESGTSEWFDILYNYLDLNGKAGKNGFSLYTDEKADADYLYSPQSHLFMSLDTPRSAKAKGAYALSKGLGGVFTWTIDQDNGLLVNAVREGLGCHVTTQVVDMQPFYFKGVNVGPSPIDKPPVAVITGPDNPVTPGEPLTYSGAKSFDPEGQALTYHWSASKGLEVIDGMNNVTIQLRVPASNPAATYTISLTVSDGKQSNSKESLIQVAGGQNLPPVVVITGPTQVNSGAVATLSGSQSHDPEGFALSYFWAVPQGVKVDSLNHGVINFTAPTVNSDTQLIFKLTATDILGLSASQSHSILVKAADAAPLWSATQSYNTGDKVSWNGYNWEAKWWNQGVEPGSEERPGGGAYPWQQLGEIGRNSATPTASHCYRRIDRNPGRARR